MRPSRSPETYRSQIGRLDPPHHPSCHPERPKGVEGSSHQFKIIHLDGSALSRQVAPTSKFVGVLVGGGALDAPCWVSETQKGGHTALPYIIYCQCSSFEQKENRTLSCAVIVLALPIFPGSRPPSIVGANELNFCVRDGNRWTLIAINTNYINTVYGIV